MVAVSVSSPFGDSSDKFSPSSPCLSKFTMRKMVSKERRKSNSSSSSKCVFSNRMRAKAVRISKKYCSGNRSSSSITLCNSQICCSHWLISSMRVEYVILSTCSCPMVDKHAFLSITLIWSKLILLSKLCG